MKIMGRFLTYILIANFVLYPTHGNAQAQTERKVAFSLVKLLASEMKAHSQDYFSAEELSKKESIAEQAVTNLALEEMKSKLRNEAYAFSDVKQEIQAQLILEEQNKLIEMKVLLTKISPDKLDILFKQAMKDGLYAQDFIMSYQSAYNQLEKIEVMMQMIGHDLSMIRSQNAKQIGLMTRADLLNQLETTGSLLSYKNDKVIAIMIIVLTVAAAGFITWGIVSATKAWHERKKRELNEDFDRREEDARNQNVNDIKTLEQTFAERERLREEGYVWQVCSTTKSVKSASCSYDFLTHTGEEVCVTHCLKQPQTGAEAMHSTSCLSAFIPNNCFIKNPSAAGYDDGYDNGYDRGYDVGYDDGYDDAYHEAYNRAYSDAYYDGYNSGYDAGFSAGYSDGTPEGTNLLMFKNKKAKASNGNDDERALGYKKGYSEGYTYALQLKLGISF